MVAYYNEPLDVLRDTVREVKDRLPRGLKRVIVYYKGDEGAEGELRGIADEVIKLENLGREGETYLVSRADCGRSLGFARSVSVSALRRLAAL